ncbi:MAG: hypothetical protein KA444_09845 [Bacteroidia bacterium]|nr:hypothetical protein [Bacteroidia bacterium]
MVNSGVITRIEVLKKYLNEDPQDSFIRYALALELFNINELQESENLFRSLLYDDPEYLAAYYQYGKLLEIIQNFKSASEIYTKGILVAKKHNNQQTLNELKAALESIADETD